MLCIISTYFYMLCNLNAVHNFKCVYAETKVEVIVKGLDKKKKKPIGPSYTENGKSGLSKIRIIRLSPVWVVFNSNC